MLDAISDIRYLARIKFSADPAQQIHDSFAIRLAEIEQQRGVQERKRRQIGSRVVPGFSPLRPSPRVTFVGEHLLAEIS